MRPDCKIQDKLKNKDIYMEQRAEAFMSLNAPLFYPYSQIY